MSDSLNSSPRASLGSKRRSAQKNRRTPSTQDSALDWAALVVERVGALRFGTVQIKVHEGQVVLVEATEQTRFQLSARAVEQTKPESPQGALSETAP